MNKWTPARPIIGVNEDGSLVTVDSWTSRLTPADAEKREGEPTDEQIRLFTERLLAMGGVPGRFWP